MPNVKGRLDHFGVDLERSRLFVAALGDDQNTVEVIDLKMGKRVFSIPGQSKPQGVFYSPDFKKVFVANGTDGTCKIFAGDTFKLIDNLPIGTDADHVGYDPATKYLYVGFGDAKSGGLAARGSSVDFEIALSEYSRCDLSIPADLGSDCGFQNLPEALLAKGSLDSSGIECFLTDDNMVRMDWFMSNLLGGAKLLVNREDAEAAHRHPG